VELVPYGGGKNDGFDVIDGGYTVGAKKDSAAVADDIPF
jgi:hypothetical protein